jgi:uncharacterized protein YukE
MANQSDDSSPKRRDSTVSARSSAGASGTVEQQIEELRSQIANITAELAKSGSEMYQAGTEQAKSAASGATRQAQAVTDAIRENPGTAATVLTTTALLGVMVGFILGQTSSNHHRYWR